MFAAVGNKLNHILRSFFFLYHFIVQKGKTFVCVSPWSSKYQAVLLAGEAHSGGVNDGHKPLNVWHQSPIEQLLVAVLEPHQKHISGNDREEQGGKYCMLIFNILRTHTCWTKEGFIKVRCSILCLWARCTRPDRRNCKETLGGEYVREQREEWWAKVKKSPKK